LPCLWSMGVELRKRYHRFPSCNIAHSRDWGACANAAKLFLKSPKRGSMTPLEGSQKSERADEPGAAKVR